MSAVDPRLVAAIREQLRRRPDAERVGWKLGVGSRERLGETVAVGHLTSATVLEPGSVYQSGTGDLHADAEIAVEIGPEGKIGGYAAALELVDLPGPQGDAYRAVVENVFHRAVAFGPWRRDCPGAVSGALVVNGSLRRSAEAAADVDALVDEARRVLEAAGERLEPGDRVITGNIVQVDVAPGDRVEADLGLVGKAWLEIR